MASPKPPEKEKRASLIKEFGSNGPYGIIGGLGLILEALLTTWLGLADSAAERITAGCLMVLVLLAFGLFVLIIELTEQRTASPQSEAAARLDVAPIPQAEADRLPNVASGSDDSLPGELLSGPGGSYVIAKPPDGWTIDDVSIESVAKEMGIEPPPNAQQLSSSILTFRFGEPVNFFPRPDRMRINGRLAPTLLTLPFKRMFQITTMAHYAPPWFTKRSLYDNLVQIAGTSATTQGASIVSIAPVTLRKTKREALVAEQLQVFEHITLDGTEHERVDLVTRFIAIRGDLFDYALGSTNLRMGGVDASVRDAAADRFDADVETLLERFRTTSPPDLPAALKALQSAADDAFAQVYPVMVRESFLGQFDVAVKRLRSIKLDTADGMTEALRILRPFRIVGDMLPPAGDLSHLWAAMDDAERGDTARLRDLLVTTLPAPGAPGLPPLVRPYS